MSDYRFKVYSTQFDDLFVEFDIKSVCDTLSSLYALDASEELSRLIRYEMILLEERRREELKDVPSVEPEPRKRTTRRCLRLMKNSK